jgi:phage-related protein
LFILRVSNLRGKDKGYVSELQSLSVAKVVVQTINGFLNNNRIQNYGIPTPI